MGRRASVNTHVCDPLPLQLTSATQRMRARGACRRASCEQVGEGVITVIVTRPIVCSTVTAQGSTQDAPAAPRTAPCTEHGRGRGSGLMFIGRMAAGPRVHGLGVLARGKFEGSRVVS